MVFVAVGSSGLCDRDGDDSFADGNFGGGFDPDHLALPRSASAHGGCFRDGFGKGASGAVAESLCAAVDCWSFSSRD
jgi:hypothetical protein